VLNVDPLGYANFTVTGGASGAIGQAGADYNSGFGYNAETGDVSFYSTSGSGIGSDSGFFGAFVGGGATLSYVTGDADNVAGPFTKCGDCTSPSVSRFRRALFRSIRCVSGCRNRDWTGGWCRVEQPPFQSDTVLLPHTGPRLLDGNFGGNSLSLIDPN
jgi:hypothetical protein